MKLPLPKIFNGVQENIKFDPPKLISRDTSCCLRDDEFGRQAVAGINPLSIERLTVFPPVSKLHPSIYGSKQSALEEEHLIGHLDGMSVQKALEENKLFILDYHDMFLPFLNEINTLDDRKAYGTRTILFLTSLGTLKPIAIELSLPPTKSGSASNKQVLTPPVDATAYWLWQLGKAHVCSNDAGAHQLIHHCWWPTLSTPNDLIAILTTIIWITTAQHAALNFGQYPYGGYVPTRPPHMRRLVPNQHDDPDEYANFIREPQQYFLSSLPSFFEATKYMAVIDIISAHSPDEEYIGERKDLLSTWSADTEIVEAFYRFSMEMKKIEKEIEGRNGDSNLRNRYGAGVSPYELLMPSSEPGIKGKNLKNIKTLVLLNGVGQGLGDSVDLGLGIVLPIHLILHIFQSGRSGDEAEGAKVFL
ncbi:hypothetical protein C1H46_026113 [Malus baccata]|uniref:Lipoxygenase domain-containing protein n=1 Tax=Malus baccata TaxID=106549 RepID=A0A540LPX4_MALBA|nr:hypothetical protein C1H46_026113 [Malus baccata]